MTTPGPALSIEGHSQRAFRLSAIMCAVLLAIQSLWLIFPELARPGIDQTGVDAAENGIPDGPDNLVFKAAQLVDKPKLKGFGSRQNPAIGSSVSPKSVRRSLCPRIT